MLVVAGRFVIILEDSRRWLNCVANAANAIGF